MRCSLKKVLQGGAAVAGVACYMMLLVLWQADSPPGEEAPSQDGEVASALAGFQERAPRSISDTELDNAVDGGAFYFRAEPSTPGLAAAVSRRLFNGSVGAPAASPKGTELADVFISVKTTKNFHQTRLNVILRTWFVLARDQTYFFSDASDPVYQSKTGGHLINTNCSSSHNRKALCCKMSVEFDTFVESNKKWFCHFDDDNYVNVPRLVKLLQKYNPQEDWYLGKPSIRAPLEIFSRDSVQQKISFWFATGGAGFCLSRALALKMIPLASGGKFISIGEKIRLPDDVTMGYIIEHLLKKKLAVIEQFHSHFEPMKFLKPDAFADQISFSYSRFGRELNVLSIDGFDPRVDPTRFLSLHCHLFPNFSFCPR